MKRLLILLGLAGLLAAGVTSGTAVAAPGSRTALQAEIDKTIALYGGRQTAPNEVSWHHGAVTMTFADPSAVVAADTEHCSSGYYCFYENIYFNHHLGRAGGRVLAFRDCGVQSFGTYGFRNETSSWVNTTGKTVKVYDYAPGADNRLWTEYAATRSAYVGDNDNDRADYFVAC